MAAKKCAAIARHQPRVLRWPVDSTKLLRLWVRSSMSASRITCQVAIHHIRRRQDMRLAAAGQLTPASKAYDFIIVDRNRCFLLVAQTLLAFRAACASLCAAAAFTMMIYHRPIRCSVTAGCQYHSRLPIDIGACHAGQHAWPVLGNTAFILDGWCPRLPALRAADGLHAQREKGGLHLPRSEMR